MSRSSLTSRRAVTVPAAWWVNGSTIERRTLGSSVSDFVASGRPSTDSVKSNVCDSAEWLTSETNAWYSKLPEYARRMERFVIPTLRLRRPTGTQRMRESVVSGVAASA